MKIVHFIICIGAAISGIFLYAYLNEWFILHIQYFKKPVHRTVSHEILSKKKIHIYAWAHNNWQSEEVEILWSSDIKKTLNFIINAWLAMLAEEKIIHKKITVQAVILCQQTEYIYISFDRNLFEKKQSTYTKWMIIESLLKTIKDAGFSYKGVYCMVHYKPLYDYHLDFSNPWPLSGFLEHEEQHVYTS